MTRDPSPQELIERAYAERLPEFVGMKVEATRRPDDESIIDVMVRVPLLKRPLRPADVISWSRIAREALEAAGDDRFPSVRSRLAKGQKIAA